jgi:carbamoyltransferase
MGAAVLAMRAMTGAQLHRPELTTRERRDPYSGARLLDDPAEADLPPGVTRTELDCSSQQQRAELARRLIAGEIVGIVAGRSEIGPRALGNRSILAHASFPEMKDVINHKIKHREWWRPFAPVCRLVDAPVYFESQSPSRYMLMNDVVVEEWRGELAAITHADGTARVQVLENRDDNVLLWDLLTEIAALGAIPVLLNTSFNLGGKPLANTTAEAIELLANSRMDAVIVEKFIFEKRRIPTPVQ